MDNQTVIFTKNLRDGSTAVVTIDGRMVTAWRGIEKLGTHYGPHHKATNLPPQFVAAIGKLALTADEAAAVETAYREHVATLLDLPAQRQRLVDALSAAEDSLANYRSDAWDSHAGGTDPFPQQIDYEARVLAARHDLTEFDTRHPEIVAGIWDRKDKDVRRWMEQ